MYLKIKRGELKKIISMAIKKAGNIRKLENRTDIPRSTLSGYNMENRLIRKENLKRIENFLKVKLKERDIIRVFPTNWRQIEGGKRCVEIKKKKGTFEKQLKLCQKGSSIHMSKWHKEMKKKSPEVYYLSQYSKFKKIGGYKFETKNKEKVRNKLELDIANILEKLNINYKYEPLVKSNKKYFFPDFLIGNKIIIECTMWRGKDKAIKLKKKIKHLKHNYKVYVVIPKNLNSYYEILNSHLIKGLDEFVPVAQTFRDLK